MTTEDANDTVYFRQHAEVLYAMSDDYAKLTLRYPAEREKYAALASRTRKMAVLYDECLRLMTT